MIRRVGVERLAVRSTVPRSDRATVLRALLVAASLLLAACSRGGAPSPTAPAGSAGAPAEPGGVVTAGIQIGSAPTAPAGWSPPTKITPLTDLPGKFQSVADTPPPGDKVRVFFFGMQF